MYIYIYVYNCLTGETLLLSHAERAGIANNFYMSYIFIYIQCNNKTNYIFLLRYTRTD